MKIWHFNERVYRRWVVLIEGSSEDFAKFLTDSGYKHTDELEPIVANGMCIQLTPENTDSSYDCFVVWLREWNLPTLVHEITHLVIAAMEQVNTPIHEATTEQVAYYTEYWFTEFQRVRRKCKNGRTVGEAKRC
ncbi:hypothetical protein KC871_04520 [Candidatus Saccharibacteria bacterium]|nr:hypothetical protein [Candidatus Saccharibacteria bacterium]